VVTVIMMATKNIGNPHHHHPRYMCATGPNAVALHLVRDLLCAYRS
jgi:hypothetical protein